MNKKHLFVCCTIPKVNLFSHDSYMMEETSDETKKNKKSAPEAV